VFSWTNRLGLLHNALCGAEPSGIESTTGDCIGITSGALESGGSVHERQRLTNWGYGLGRCSRRTQPHGYPTPYLALSKIAPQCLITSTGWLLIALDDGTVMYGQAELEL
jgi:hypothetical protein